MHAYGTRVCAFVPCICPMHAYIRPPEDVHSSHACMHSLWPPCNATRLINPRVTWTWRSGVRSRTFTNKYVRTAELVQWETLDTSARMAAWGLRGQMGLHGCMGFAWADGPAWLPGGLHGQMGLHGSLEVAWTDGPHGCMGLHGQMRPHGCMGLAWADGPAWLHGVCMGR